MNATLPTELVPKEDERWVLTKEDTTINITTEKGEVVGNVPASLFEGDTGESPFERRKSYRARASKDGALDLIRYTPLHGHSGYSMLDGASKVKEMAEVAEYAMALTDHGNMFGAVDFYNTMKKAGKKPILGCEVYAETIENEKKGNHLLLLAETTAGYKNLVKLVSLSNENKKGKFNYVTYDLLKEYSDGLICTSACLGGEISQNIMQGNDEQALKVAKEMQSIFGANNFFVEIQRHNLPEEEVVNPVLIDIARTLDAPMIATADSHYTHEEDREGQEVLMCLSTNDTMTNPDRFKLTGEGYHIHSSEEMVEKFKDIPEVLDNTLDIAERCNVDLDPGKIFMPNIEVPHPFTSEAEYFKHLCWEGFEKRFKGTSAMTSEEYKERLEFEMGVITDMGFPGYFIITWDVIRYANENGILVGPGRGSACGSLVAYVLEITDVDPIPFGLLFERFLNPDRYSMPDIDTDFPNTRREEIIEYTRKKYGERSVARIVTYGTLSAKRVVRDVTKVLDYPFAFGGKIADAIPSKPNISLDDAFKESAEFKRLYDEDKDAKRIIDMSLQLENLPRNTGLHACGVIIAPGSVDSFVPTFYALNKDTGSPQLATQYDKDQVEEMGLLKMDFLGLKTLGVIEESISLTNEYRRTIGMGDITMRSIPVDDVKTYKNIAKGNTSGVFQLEGPGMTKTIGQILDGVEHETEESDEEYLLRLIATISLYRPGPMDEIPNYVENMKDAEAIEYELPAMKERLEETKGIIVYQEQVMQLVRDLAGFSRGQSDIVRKGMAKKVPGLMEEWGKAFIYGSDEKDIVGCVPSGIDEAIAKGIWDKMVKFSDYAFNKSHATGYSFVSARTGWLATHYPIQFFTAMMNIFVEEKEKAQKYLSTAKKLDIPILPPSVNYSQEMFSVDNDSIRFGLKGISHVGKTASMIINERETNGLFESMKDFVVRMLVNHKLNSKTVSNLILAGALDEFDGTRLEKTRALDLFLELGKFMRDNQQLKRRTLFDMDGMLSQAMFTPDLSGKTEMKEEDKLAKERELAGFYITGHPLSEYQMTIDEGNYTILSDLIDDLEERMAVKGDSFSTRNKLSIAGVVTEVKTLYTKKTGDPLKVFTLEDETGSIECLAFSDLIQEKRGLFNENDLLFLEGRVKVDDGEITFMTSSAEDLHVFKQDDLPSRFRVIGHRDKAEARKQYKWLIHWATTRPEWAKNKKNIPVTFIQDNQEYDMGINIPYGYNELKEIKDVIGTASLKADYT